MAGVDVPETLRSACVPPVIVDPGDAELLAPAESLADPLLLLDHEVPRTEARRLKLRLCGMLGILVRAYRKDLLWLDQAELQTREIAARPDT